MNDIWLLDKCFNKWPMLTDCIGLEGMLLQNFLLRDGNWNLLELNRFFNGNMVNLIVQHSVIHEGEEDQMELLYQLSSKSISAMAYAEIIKSHNHYDDSKFANWLRKLKLKPKVELFWWRMSRFAIPTNEFLKFRRLCNSDLCARGCLEVEDYAHVVVHCKFLIDIISILRSWVSTFHFSSLADCLFQLRHFSKVSLDTVKIYCTTIFCSWNCRKDVKHANSILPISMTAANILFTATNNYPMLVNWDASLLKESEASWHPLPPDWIKINVDASLLDSHTASIGGSQRFQGKIAPSLR
ncbi:uncharacterized protein LOC114580160 [Dendrobium catenatum]|uniref:uncharacterized protein LOC114580160 n=1 Tax=Dendrobium catenatum TaxID=906689 RepID=UPI00109FCAE7|nr:uncharacterized protein LOC114580160 [Dendrobium catenatum]